MSVADAIINPTNERKQMLEIGQQFTTTTSGVVGIIKAIDNHPSGVNRVLLDVEGQERWTSVSAK
jgi:hypothetical protein